MVRVKGRGGVREGGVIFRATARRVASQLVKKTRMFDLMMLLPAPVRSICFEVKQSPETTSSVEC